MFWFKSKPKPKKTPEPVGPSENFHDFCRRVDEFVDVPAARRRSRWSRLTSLQNKNRDMLVALEDETCAPVVEPVLSGGLKWYRVTWCDKVDYCPSEKEARELFSADCEHARTRREQFWRRARTLATIRTRAISKLREVPEDIERLLDILTPLELNMAARVLNRKLMDMHAHYMWRRSTPRYMTESLSTIISCVEARQNKG